MTTVIIGCTGAGAAIARRLASMGRPLHLVSRTETTLKSLAESTKAKYTIADVLNSQSYEDVLKSLASHGPIAGLVYAVGSIPLKPLKMTTAADFMQTFQLNTVGAALALKHLSPSLAAGSSPGSVVLFSTIAAGTGFPNHSAIAAAKAGVEGLARSVAAELAPKVRVNVIAPALTDTPLAARFTSNEATRKALAEAHPIPRLGSVDDLAAMATFLLDNEQSGWATGQVFHVDGGRSTVRPKN